MTRRVKIAVIGTGRMGSVHVRNIVRQIPEADLVAVCDIRLEVAQAVADECGIQRVVKDYHDLLGDKDIEAILIASSTDTHAFIMKDVAQNLTPDVLEQIRLISNLETETDKLIQIVLAGQPELGKLLEKPELRQLNQRIARFKSALAAGGPAQHESAGPHGGVGSGIVDCHLVLQSVHVHTSEAFRQVQQVCVGRAFTIDPRFFIKPNRVDYQISSKFRMYGRWSFNDFGPEDRGDWTYETARGLNVGGLVRNAFFKAILPGFEKNIGKE